MMPIWAVGTTNRAKVESVSTVVNKCFPTQYHDVRAISVQSGVSDQPMSAEESQCGAVNRAKAALLAVPEADYGVGLEGGVEKIGSKWFECGWMAVLERKTSRCGIGSSARFEMSETIMRPILEEKKELAEIMDALTGDTDLRSGLGAMGVLTGGHLGRAAAYEHGMIFALAPFLSDSKFW